MGSRKKKIQPPSKSRTFLDSYKALPLMERIAYKAWAHWYGRQRFNLLDLCRQNWKVQQWRNY